MSACAGIDVSKDHLDWTVGASSEVRQVPNTPTGVRRLVRKLRTIELGCVVLEATGGYERLLFQALSDAGLPVVRVNPKRVRDFGKGLGILAKNDTIDARLLALFGSKAEPRLETARSAAGRRMGELAARRRQLIQLITMEKNRREQMPRWLRADQEGLIRILESRVEKIDALLDEAIADERIASRGCRRFRAWVRRRPVRSSPTYPSSANSIGEESPHWSVSPRSRRTAVARVDSEGSTVAVPRLARRSTWQRSSPRASTRP